MSVLFEEMEIGSLRAKLTGTSSHLRGVVADDVSI